MSVRTDLTWKTPAGGAAEVVAIDANTIALRSETPHPPGSRIEGRLAPSENVVLTGTVRVKVHGSKKEADGAFRIDGRPIDLGKDLREALAAKIAPNQA